MSEGINTHCLMHYRAVALVNQCRRLIRDEFGTRLSLTDPRLRQELGRFAERSLSSELARLMDDIAREAGAPSQAEPEPETPAPKRMYRGQPLPKPGPAGA
ncbi:MAG TPA: hypothetical protein VFX91_04850 [Alcanivorax sp.]|nr:hypothetical protein [Alcanivorax sp.]